MRSLDTVLDKFGNPIPLSKADKSLILDFDEELISLILN